MPTVTIDSISTAFGTASYTNTNDSPMKVGKTAGYTMHARVAFAAINPSWYIKSIKLQLRRVDGWASRSLRFGTNASASFGDRSSLDWSKNYSIPKGYEVRQIDVTAYKSILQGYAGNWYFHVTHGSGDSSYAEFNGGSSANRPKLIVEYEEATLSVPGDEFTIDAQKAITVGTAGSGLTHKVSYSIGSASGTVGTGIVAGATVNWKPPAALATQIPSAMAGTIRLTLESYLSGVLTSTLHYDYALNIPASYVPTVSSSAFALSNPTGDTIGIYVQGRSRTICTIGATAPGGASIVEYRLTIGGKTKKSTTSPITSDVLTSTGALTATLTVVDSRGQTATQTKTSAVAVYPYSAPVITALSVERALVDGTLSNDGTYLKFTLTCAFSSLNGLNTKAGSIKYKPAGGSFGAATSLTSALTSVGGYLFTITGTFGAGNVGVGGYIVSVSLTDRYNTSTDEAELSSRAIWIDRHGSGSGVAIGKRATVEGLFDVGIASRFRDAVQFDGAVTIAADALINNTSTDHVNKWGLIAEYSLNKTVFSQIDEVIKIIARRTSAIDSYAPSVLLTLRMDSNDQRFVPSLKLISESPISPALEIALVTSEDATKAYARLYARMSSNSNWSSFISAGYMISSGNVISRSFMGNVTPSISNLPSGTESAILTSDYSTLTLLNGFTGWIRYNMLPSKLVIVRFSITPGTTSSGTTVAQLPSGVRPDPACPFRLFNNSTNTPVNFRAYVSGNLQTGEALTAGANYSGVLMFFLG